MPKNIFSGLEDLGFDDIDEIDLYHSKKEEIEKEELLQLTDEEKQKNYYMIVKLHVRFVIMILKLEQLKLQLQEF